jgi:hypothetical protein
MLYMAGDVLKRLKSRSATTKTNDYTLSPAIIREARCSSSLKSSAMALALYLIKCYAPEVCIQVHGTDSCSIVAQSSLTA